MSHFDDSVIVVEECAEGAGRAVAADVLLSFAVVFSGVGPAVSGGNAEGLGLGNDAEDGLALLEGVAVSPGPAGGPVRVGATVITTVATAATVAATITVVQT